MGRDAVLDAARAEVGPDAGRRWAQRVEVRVGALAAVISLSAFNLLWRLDRADWHFDEPLYRRDGWDAVHLHAPTPDHPLLGKLVIGVSQELFGRGVVGVRLLPALASWSATFAIFELGRRINGWWAGVAAAALWATLPRALVVAGQTTGLVRADRYGLLDTVAFAIVAWGLLAAWTWIDAPTTRRAVAAGVVLGLAVATKLSTTPALLAVGLVGLVAIRPVHTAVRQVTALASTAVVAFVLTYLPFGTAGWDMVRSMVTWQLDHARIGHTTVLGGSVWSKEPWWANPSNWFTGMGGVAAVTLLALCFASWRGRDRLGVAFLWTVLLATVLALALAPIALAHYWTAWVAPMVVLAGVGLRAMTGSGGWMRRAGAVAATILLLAGLAATLRIAALERGDYARMVSEVNAKGVAPTTALTLGTRLDVYFPEVRSTYATLAGRDVAMDLLVIEDQFAAATRPAVIARLRLEARENDLQPHRVGHLEYWYRPR